MLIKNVNAVKLCTSTVFLLKFAYNFFVALVEFIESCIRRISYIYESSAESIQGELLLQPQNLVILAIL